MGNDSDVIILGLPPWWALETNALQQASTLVVQKSIKEGFGLTVTEALWKGKQTNAKDQHRLHVIDLKSLKIARYFDLEEPIVLTRGVDGMAWTTAVQ